MVRPLSSLGQSDSSSEMLEMISESKDKQLEEKDAGKCSKDKLSLEERLTAAEKLSLGERLGQLGQLGQLSQLGQLAGSSSHHSSQILLYKAQNAEVRNNTAGAFDDSVTHKDFAKRVINLKNTAPAPVTRTLQPSPHVDRGGPKGQGGPGDVLTILV